MSTKKTTPALFPVINTPSMLGSSILDLVSEVEKLPEPKESKWNIDSVLSGFLSLMKLGRTEGERGFSAPGAERTGGFYGRKGFTVPELVRFVDGKDVSAYELQSATEEINELLGFSLVDDPTDLRATLQGSTEKPRQIPGAPYVDGSLMSLGLVTYTPKGGNKGRGYAFTVELTKVREHYSSGEAK